MHPAFIPDLERRSSPRWVIVRIDGAYWTGNVWTFDLQQAKSWINPSVVQAEALRIRGWVQQVARRRLPP